MNSQKQHIKHLWQLYLADEAGAEEVKELFRLVSQAGENEDHAEVVQELLSAVMAEKKLGTEMQEEMIRSSLQSKGETADLKSGADNLLSAAPAQRIHFLRTSWFRYAAILILIAGTATFVYLNQTQKEITAKKTSAQQDRSPGGSKAILTLADGSTIVLDNAANGSLAQQGNTKILKLSSGSIAYDAGSASGEVLYNTISTPRGGQYQVILPDGSKVWLNAASSITYPTVFTGSKLEVSVTGEAYFEVAKHAKKPFIVNVDGTSSIEVLGTNFNVNSYRDEGSINTTLLEGSVKVVTNDRSLLLKPGQQALITDKLSMNSNPDIEQVMAWKNGFFHFELADIQTIMRQLSRWYDINVEYKGDVKERFVATISRDKPISTILKMLETTGLVKFTIKGKTIIVE